jgi:hypothetical protein
MMMMSGGEKKIVGVASQVGDIYTWPLITTTEQS